MLHSDPAVVMRFTSFMIGLGSLYVFCYFGKLSTESFANMASCIFDSNWQQLDLELKNYLILMIRNSQQPFYYRGYGMFTLDLETFSKVY